MKNLSFRLTVLLSLSFLLACAPVRTVERSESPTAGQPAQLSPPLKMTVGRAAHTATLLSNGKVLIAGGFREEGTREIAIASAELYDPVSKSFTPTGAMNEPRSGHTATLLPDGKVLIVGGWGVSQRLASAELYDPEAGRFTYTTSMAGPRGGMTATLLRDGRVLIAGGSSARNTLQVAAEIYDPDLAHFVATAALQSGREAHTATLLNDGRVLIAGGNSAGNGVLKSAEIYDASTEQFTQTGELGIVRHKHAAVLLPDGNVLIVGGSNQDDWQGQYASAELYDVAAGLFSQAAPLNNERFKLADAALLLANGDVLIGGGHRTLELFDTQSERFVAGEELDSAYYYMVLTRLQSGSVLITGGYDQGIQPTDQAWLYQ